MEVVDHFGLPNAPTGVLFVDGGVVVAAPDQVSVHMRPEAGGYFAFFSHTESFMGDCFYRFPDGLSREEMEQQAQDLLRVLQLNFSQE